MKVESSVRGYFSSSFNSDIRGRGEGGGPRIASGYYLSLLAAGMCPRRLRRGSRFAKFEKRPGARGAVGEHSVVPTENGLAAWRERTRSDVVPKTSPIAMPRPRRRAWPRWQPKQHYK